MTKQLPATPAPTGEEVEAAWHLYASQMMRGLKYGSGMTYAELAEAMGRKNLGTETAHQLKAKMGRGKFSFVFFLRVMNALDLPFIHIADLPQPPKRLEHNSRRLLVTFKK